MKRVLFIMVVILPALVGCGRKYHLKRDRIEPEVRWAAPQAAPSNAGVVEAGAFDGRLQHLWKRRSTGKPAGPLALANGALIYPDTKKKIRFYDPATGHELGRMKVKGSPTSGLAVSDSLGFYALGQRANYVAGFDLIRYKTLWKRRIKDAKPGPIILYNRLIVSSGDGRVEAYGLDDGEPLWHHDLGGRLEASASFADGRIWQANDRGELVALSPSDGSKLLQVQLSGPVVSPPAVADKVYVAVMTGRVAAVNPTDGALLWETDLGSPIWTTPAVAHGRLYVGLSGGGVVALDAADGHEVWSHDTESVVRASAVVVGPVVALGTMSGVLLTLDAADGAMIDSVRLDGAIRFSPVTDGQRLYVATQSGRIFCFGENHEQADRADHRVSPESRPQRRSP